MGQREHFSILVALIATVALLHGTVLMTCTMCLAVVLCLLMAALTVKFRNVWRGVVVAKLRDAQGQPAAEAHLPARSVEMAVRMWTLSLDGVGVLCK